MIAAPDKLFRVSVQDPDGPFRESHTSIMMRTARENDVSCGQLIDRCYHGTSAAGTIKSRSQGMGGSIGQSINGHSETAAVFTRRTEMLTGLIGVSHSTANGFREFTTHNGLLRSGLAWSPEYLSKRKVSYLPLQWSFDAVRVCPESRKPLISVCPNPKCRRTLKSFRGASRADLCSWCGCNFSCIPKSYSETDEVASSVKNMAYEVWVAEQVGDGIAAAARGERLCPKPFSKVVKHWLDLFEIRSPWNAGKLIGTGDNAVINWLTHGAKPQLRSTLNMCWVFGVGLRDFLKMRVPQNHDGKLRPTCEANRRAAAPSRRVPIDRKKMESDLLLILHKPKYLDLSFTEICHTKIKRREVIVRQYFPDLAKKISARYLKYRKVVAEEKRHNYCEKLKAMARILHSFHIVPNHKNLASHMSPAANLRCEWAIKALDEVRAELGYSDPNNQLWLPIDVGGVA